MGETQGSPKLDREDVETVLAGYECWNSGDLEGLTALFAEDITYQNAPEWPGQRVYSGDEEVTSFLAEEVAKIIKLRPVEIIHTDTIGNDILIELRARTRGELSGLDLADVNVTIFHVASVRGGKVERVRVYLDRDEAVRAAKSGQG